jgi:integrase
MATLVKRGKKWSIKLYDHNGKQKWVTGYTDKAETQRLANKLENEKTAIQRGDIDPQNEARKVARARPASAHIDQYEIHLEALGRNKWHVSYTIGDLKNFFEHAKLTHASQVQRSHVTNWIHHLKATNPTRNSPRTINRRVGAVQAFLRYLQQSGAVTDYVLFKFPKQKVVGTDRRKRRPLTAAECVNLLDKAPDDRQRIYRFALLTGFRFAEIASMTPSNFNFDAMTVTVRVNDAKNKDKDQTIPLHADLVPVVRELCEGKGRGDRIFATPRREDAARLLREDCKTAKVDTTHVDFHCLRHTFITRLAGEKIHPKILQSLARHSTLETTLTYYTHFRQDDERNALGLLVS